MSIGVKSKAYSQSTKRKRPKRKGRLTIAEANIIDTVAHDAPSPKQSEQLAIILRRDERTVRDAIIAARTRLQHNAEKYADIHMSATESALVVGDNDTARKSAQWALENLSAQSNDGTTERIITPVANQQSAPPVVQIGIALGGMPIPRQTTED